MSDIDIELGQTETPKSEHETEADRVEKSLRRWIYNSQDTLLFDDWYSWSWEVLCYEQTSKCGWLQF